MLCALALVAGAAVACGDSKSTASPLGEPAAPPPPTRGAARGPEGDAGPDAGSQRAEFREDDFVETERNRDPFRSFARVFASPAGQSDRIQREVLLDRYAIDELKLVAIVTGAAEHRAMFIDPTSKGWIVKRGQFIGKEEIVHGKGPAGADYALNWKVDRIREGDVVLVREDPAHSDVPPATRIVPLRPEGSEEKR
jgi:type IV pilus assembly protein PilP